MNTPVKKIYYKNTHALVCNIVSNFKQSTKNFQRFKIKMKSQESEGHFLCDKSIPICEWIFASKFKKQLVKNFRS